MNFIPALMGLSIYLLIWEKLPEWGNWFNKIIEFLPKPLSSLYEGWKCPYCSGFWISLALHALTGIQTIPALANMPLFLGKYGIFLAWFLDALATATLILYGKLLLEAIAGYAIKTRLLKEEIEKSSDDEESE